MFLRLSSLLRVDKERVLYFFFGVILFNYIRIYSEALRTKESFLRYRKDTGQRIKILKKTITLIFLCNFAKGKSYFTDKKQDFFAFIRNSFAHKIREDKNLVIISCFKSRS